MVEPWPSNLQEQARLDSLKENVNPWWSSNQDKTLENLWDELSHIVSVTKALQKEL